MSEKSITEQVVDQKSNLDNEFYSEKDYKKDSLKSKLKTAKIAIQSTIIAMELAPTNEAIRYGAFGYALSQTRNPLIGGAVLGGSTLIVEGGAALACADVLSSNKANKVIEKINKTVHKIIPPEAKMSRLTEAGIALYGGSVIVMAEKQREDPSRTMEDNRRYGLTTAGWLAGVLAVEGALISNGIENYNDPKSVGATLLAAGGLFAATKWAKNKLKSNNKPQNIPEKLSIVDGEISVEENVKTKPRYDLSQFELDSLEKSLVSDIEKRYKQEGLYAAWINSNHPYANFLRMHEAKYFPEVAETISDEAEDNSLFLAIIDTRKLSQRVVHGTTVSGAKLKNKNEKFVQELDRNCSTGFIVVDDLVEINDFSAQEFKDYYFKKGIDIDKCISVETNFRIGPKVPRYNGLRPAQYAYATVFNLLKQQNKQLGNSAVFSSINRPSAISFNQLGLDYEPLMGRTDLKTPEAELGLDYLPVAILYSEKNINVFNKLGIPLPEHVF